MITVTKYKVAITKDQFTTLSLRKKKQYYFNICIMVLKFPIVETKVND